MKYLLEIMGNIASLQIALVIIAISVAAWVVSCLLEKKARSMDPADADALYQVASRRCCSEFDIFLETAKEWGLKESAVEADFRRYVLKGQMPQYVRHYLLGLNSEENHPT